MSVRSKPSDSYCAGRPANTTAVFAARAARSAAEISSPVVLPSARQPCTHLISGQQPAALVSLFGFIWLLPAP